MEMRVRNQHDCQNRNRDNRHRRGFTLLELMVTIVVIGLIAAILLPAIQGVVGTAKDAAVRNEISQLETAIANFKAKYGIEPPSGITLYESATGWATDTTGSKALIQRMWPNFDFNINRDINSNQSRSDTISMVGSECLVFFLGGVNTYSPGPDNKPGIAGTDDDMNGVIDDDNEYFFSSSADDTVAFVPSGFSKNPANPFVVGIGQVTEGPFFEFNPNRLKAIGTSPRVYLDPLSGQTKPYFYLSSNEGRNYDDGHGPGGGFTHYMSSPSTAHKAKSFQIISPGIDGKYGVGGLYDTNAANNGLTSLDDHDNITNLASGRLKP